MLKSLSSFANSEIQTIAPQSQFWLREVSEAASFSFLFISFSYLIPLFVRDSLLFLPLSFVSLRFCIFSPEHYCIHPVVSKSPNKNEECKKVIDEGSCDYFRRVKSMAGCVALKNKNKGLWDIEDLVEIGKGKARGEK